MCRSNDQSFQLSNNLEMQISIVTKTIKGVIAVNNMMHAPSV
jgi:hypothetical protein